MIDDRGDNWSPFGAATWMAWLGATVMAVLTIVGFTYATFDTKDAARDREGLVVSRLDRMESKLDRVVEQTKN